MNKTIIKECPKYGMTEHVLQTNGSYKRRTDKLIKELTADNEEDNATC